MSKVIKPSIETQLMAKYIAIVVRNAMEDFHCQHLTDTQMQELNPIVRNAICSALHACINFEEYENAKSFVDYNMARIPSYWEEPEINAFLRRASGPD